ncbi:MAG: Bax inhibitor-1/YccA family protein [Phycisphaerales bacterium]|nr:Bax inhibitor-1/YccA family protein [Phycisphaerales bacterium]
MNRSVPWAQSDASDRTAGRFMNSVYAWMCVGLALTAVVAWGTSQSPAVLKMIFGSGLVWALIIAELVLVVVISSAVNKINASVATGLFLLYAALNGLTLCSVFLMYNLPALGGAFAVSAGMFGVTSFYGYVTKRDLSRLGSLMFMALIGLILASVVNIFVASSALYWLVTYAGVFIFVGLTAYDTQKLKQLSYQVEGNSALSARMSIVGSLMLYLDFINLFLFMLRIMGGGRRS